MSKKKKITVTNLFKTVKAIDQPGVYLILSTVPIHASGGYWLFRITKPDNIGGMEIWKDKYKKELIVHHNTGAVEPLSALLKRIPTKYKVHARGKTITRKMHIYRLMEWI